MERHRIDNWLKHVCLFKHRADAAEACKGGHVKINGQRVKPAATVRENDVVEFLAGDTYRRVVAVVIPEGQLAKESARTAYLDETPKQERVERDPSVVFRDRGAGRPTKKERREMDRLGVRRR